jgi:hypothetical protein
MYEQYDQCGEDCQWPFARHRARSKATHSDKPVSKAKLNAAHLKAA